MGGEYRRSAPGDEVKDTPTAQQRQGKGAQMGWACGWVGGEECKRGSAPRGPLALSVQSPQNLDLTLLV